MNQKDVATTFIELAPPVGVGSCECILELEAPGGAKMRIHTYPIDSMGQDRDIELFLHGIVLRFR